MRSVKGVELEDGTGSDGFDGNVVSEVDGLVGGRVVYGEGY